MTCRSDSISFDSDLIFRQPVSHANFKARSPISCSFSKEHRTHYTCTCVIEASHVFGTHTFQCKTLRAAPVQWIWSGVWVTDVHTAIHNSCTVISFMWARSGLLQQNTVKQYSTIVWVYTYKGLRALLSSLILLYYSTLVLCTTLCRKGKETWCKLVYWVLSSLSLQSHP